MTDWNQEQGEGERVQRKWVEEAMSLRAELATAHATIADLEAQVKRWEAKEVSRGSHCADLEEELRDTIARLEGERDALKLRSDTLWRVVADVQDSQGQINDYQASLDTFDRELDELCDRLLQSESQRETEAIARAEKAEALATKQAEEIEQLKGEALCAYCGISLDPKVTKAADTVTATLAARDAEIRELVEALVECAVALEVLRAMPPRDCSPEMVAQFTAATDRIRAVLARHSTEKETE